MRIDVVICTKNTALTLRKCLWSLFRSDVPIRRVLIIDRFSTDGTQDIAEEFGCEVFESMLPLGQARRLGAMLCDTEYFLSLDADMMLPKDFYAKLQPYIGEYVVVKGAHFNVLSDKHRCVAMNDYLWMHDKIGSMGNCFVHTKTFLEVSSNWPSNIGAGEDALLYQACAEKGLPVYQDVNVVCEHRVYSVVRLWKQTAWYSSGAIKAGVKGRVFNRRRAFIPLEGFGFVYLGLRDAIRWRCPFLLVHQFAKMLWWFKGCLLARRYDV